MSTIIPGENDQYRIASHGKFNGFDVRHIIPFNWNGEARANPEHIAIGNNHRWQAGKITAETIHMVIERADGVTERHTLKDVESFAVHAVASSFEDLQRKITQLSAA